MTNPNTNYPASNLLDRHPRKYALSTASTTTITATIDPNVGAFALFNTNALSATLTLKNGSGATLLTEFFDISGIVDYFTLMMDIQDPHYSLWFDYGTYYQGAVHSVTAALDTTNTDTEVYAGVAYASSIREFPNIQYGCQETLVDYSIVKELSNGSYYYRKRDVVKKFQCSLTLNRSNRDFYTFFHSICQAAGPAPMAVKLTDVNGTDWTVYGKLIDMPSGTHDYPDYATVSFGVLEVV